MRRQARHFDPAIFKKCNENATVWNADRPRCPAQNDTSDLIVEDGFNRSPAFAGVLAALMPSRGVDGINQ